VGGQRHTPAAVPPGRETRYPFYRRLGGPQVRPGRVRKIWSPPRLDPPDRPARSESLYLLSYPGTPTSYVHCLSCLILYFIFCLGLLNVPFHVAPPNISGLSPLNGATILHPRVKTCSADGISEPQAASSLKPRWKSFATIQSSIMYETNLAYVKILPGRWKQACARAFLSEFFKQTLTTLDVCPGIRNTSWNLLKN